MEHAVVGRYTDRVRAVVKQDEAERYRAYLQKRLVGKTIEDLVLRLVTIRDQGSTSYLVVVDEFVADNGTKLPGTVPDFDSGIGL